MLGEFKLTIYTFIFCLCKGSVHKRRPLVGEEGVVEYLTDCDSRGREVSKKVGFPHLYAKIFKTSVFSASFVPTDLN